MPEAATSQQPETMGVIYRMPTSELHPHPDNPFGVRDDPEMQELVDSVQKFGVLVPAIARPCPDGGFELISGHRRKHASELAGLDFMPVIVLNLNDDEAIIQLVDSNIQRENVLPSERAKAYKMRMEAIKRTAGRPSKSEKENSPKFSANFRSDDELGEKAGVSGDTIRNYISLTNLIPELMQMVDEKKIALTPAYQIATLPHREQAFTAVNNSTGDKFVIGPTNANGYAKSGEMPLGVYTVTETVFPDGYEASGDTTWTVTLSKDTPNQTVTINAENRKITGSLTIKKITNTGKNVSGWSFGVYTDAACKYPISGSPFKTGSDGTVTVTGLTPGTYYVKELNGSDNFWVTDNGVKTVKVSANSTATVTVENTHYGYAQIVKTTNTGKNLGGWKFNIYTDADCKNIVTGSPFITDDEGKISVKLLPGTYYVREIDESAQNPEWVYDTTLRTVTVVAGDTKSVTFTNSQKTYVKIIKETNTGKNLGGWQFNIYTDAACTQLVSGSPFTSKDDGTIIAQVAPGTYFIEEINPPADYPDWDLDDGCHIVTVNAGETASVWFENIHYGYAEIVKQTNTGDNLSGWKFNVYTDEACTQLVEGSPFTTGATGTITTRLLPGDYYVQEVDESEQNPGWTYDTTVRKVSVVAGDTKSVTFTNTHSGKVKIIKSMPDGGSVAGWVFEVYKADGTTLVGTYTTTEDGTIVSDYLYIQQTKMIPTRLYSPMLLVEASV